MSNFYSELIAELKRLTGIDITVSQEEVGAEFYATVIALIKGIGSIGGLSIPEGYNFDTVTDRDNYFSSALDELVLEKTYIWIRTDNSLQLWAGETNPASYDNLNWEDRTGFIKGDKGDSGSVGKGVPNGGATNKVLKKLSPADYDTDWTNITNAPNNSILIASGGDLADSGKRFNDLGITVADIWSANKVMSQIDAQVAKTITIKGNWNANTNIPNLDSILEGNAYIVSVAGTNYGDIYEVNDWIVKTATGYAKINNNLATVVFSAIGGSPLDNPALVLEFDKYINKISTLSTGNIPTITADGQIEDSTYSISDLFTKDLTDYTEKTTVLSNNDKVLVFDESTGLWKYSRVDKIPSSATSTLKISSSDTIAGYLEDKIVGTTDYIVLTKLNIGAEEQVQIEIGSNVFDKSTDTSDDITEGTTNLLLTNAERTLIGALINNGDGLSYLANDGTYKSVDFATWGNITGTLSNQTDLQSALDDKENTANKNQANGYVGLDTNTKIDISHIPKSALERLVIVADETARFALTTAIVQNGDVIKQQDIGTMFYVVDDTNLNNASGYEEFAAGTAGAVEWSNILNKPIDIFYTGINTTDDITEGTTNLFDKEVVFTGGNNVTIIGTYPSFEIQDNTMSSTDIQNALDTKLNSADNLTDVADQQTALNNITAVSGATDEYVLTKDTSTGNAMWKEVIITDELLKVSANDTTAGYLEDKIVGATNKITVTPLDNSGYKDLQIGIGTDIFDKSINTMDDVADGDVYVKTENNLTDILKTNYDSAYTHSVTSGNPHGITKTDIGLENVVNVDTSNPANIAWSASYRTVTDTEKTTWNGKQNALGYTAENSVNKKTVWQTTPNNTAYPSEKLVKDSLDLKVDKVTGKQLSTEDYTTEEKTKLSGIAIGANNYTHPTGDGYSHIPATSTTNNGKVLKAGTTENSASWDNVYWSEIANKPTTFTPTTHNHVISEVTNLQTSLDAKVNTSDVVTTATANKILKLDANAKLPASITGNADGNATTATKLQTARTINGVSFDGSANITINAVDSTARIASSEKGAINGVATLDSTGKVPSSQLPSYVDDVLEYTNYAGFPATGETGKIYVDLTTNKCYRWSGSAYVYITSGAVDSVNGKTGVVLLAKADVGLANVTDNAQVKKVASSTDKAIMRWDGATGDLPQNSLVTISDTGTVNIPTGQNYNINGVNLKDVTETLTNKTLTSPVLNTEITGTGITTTGEANKLVKTVSAGNISMTQSVDGSVGVMLNNTSTGASANTGFQAKGNNLNYLSAWSYGSGRANTIFGKTIGSYSALLAQGADNAGLLLGTMSSAPLVIGVNGIERYNISSNGVHTFSTPAATSYNAIFRNSSYSTTDASGTSSIKIGYSNHDGVKIEAYKDAGFNISGIKFYGEYGIGTERLLLNLRGSDSSAIFSGNITSPTSIGTIVGYWNYEDTTKEIYIGDSIRKTSFRVNQREGSFKPIGAMSTNSIAGARDFRIYATGIGTGTGSTDGSILEYDGLNLNLLPKGFGRITIGSDIVGNTGMTATQAKLAISNTASSIILAKAYSAIANQGGMLCLGKSRGATAGTETTTTNGDGLGYIAFEGVGSGSTPVIGATITSIQTGTAGASFVPADLVFTTTNGTSQSEVMRVTQDRKVNFTTNEIKVKPTTTLSLVADTWYNVCESPAMQPDDTIMVNLACFISAGNNHSALIAISKSAGFYQGATTLASSSSGLVPTYTFRISAGYLQISFNATNLPANLNTHTIARFS